MSQINNWLLTIFGTFVVVIVALFVYMNGRFSEAQTDRNTIKQVQNAHSISLAKQETMMQLLLLKEGFTFADIDKAIAKSQQSDNQKSNE